MSEKFQNKYRIESARLRYWDYGWNGAYFVTICTKNRECFFGKIVGTQDSVETQDSASLQGMQFSEIGKIANDYWLQIPDHFPFVKLGNHVVMPNHVHGIVIIDKPDDGRGNDATVVVETQNFASLPPPKNRFGPQSKNLASIIRGYKSGVKKYATMNNIDFAWQSRFHDHIIRDEKSFHTISQYIVNNPAKWQEDRFFN